MVAAGRRAGVSLLLLLLLFCAAGNVRAEDPQASPPYVPGRILVKLRPGIAIQEVSGGKPIPQIGVVSIAVEKGRELEAARTLGERSGVEFAEPDYVVTAFKTPDDPLFDFYQWNLRVIRAEQAWDIQVGKSDITIAVLDTGVDLSHPDLSAKILPGLNLLDPAAPPQDDNGHGSHVAGIATAASNNGIGVAGVSWGAKVLPVKVLDQFGTGSVGDLAQGIIWAADHGARVMNVSSGTEGLSQTLQDAVNYAHDIKGVLIAASVGNDGGFGGFNRPNYPAALPNVIGVGATDSNSRRADFSQRGPFVAVGAPGVTVVSAVLTGRGPAALGGDYDYKSGTSMASPHVAGLAALVWSASTSLTNDQVATLIESTAIDLGIPGKDDFFGYGRIDAYGAVRAAATSILSSSPGGFLFLADLDTRQSVTHTLSLGNRGGQPLLWTATISPTVSWLTVSQPSGRVEPLSSGSISVAVQPMEIAPAGTYTSSVILEGQGDIQNSPVAIPVSLKVVDGLNKLNFPLILNSTVSGW